ncbi:2Fe-2S iron-sulfur cluster-binding protein [Alienimonas californiensis]|uniref:2Fe-2S iron-sulfur cluster-binding protein n=1 Tax=Alienimonas californiensis TaxID=2527989 RepID=UPI0013FD0340|nr:2Fe-2S iron-sulfur cluster-binding protein [Alienimonas californiensis]
MFDAAFWRWAAIINGGVPLALLAWDAWQGALGPDPVDAAIRTTGLASVTFLVLTLAVTPIRLLTGWTDVLAMRRALGLYAFAYAVAHLVVYIVWEQAGSLRRVGEELAARSYLQIGLAALLAMTPLAITSVDALVRRLGAWWKRLHRLIYVAAALGVIHFYMQVKSDVRLPLIYGAVTAGLIGFRAAKHYRDLRIAARRAPAGPAEKPTSWRGQLEVARIFEETPDVKTYRLVPPAGGELPFNYAAGQYLTVSLPVQTESGPATLKRSYSFSSAPTRRGYCEITVKRDPSGIGSRALHDGVSEGDLLTVAGPAGRFTFQDAAEPVAAPAGVVLIAGGVGLTPILSILRSLTDRSWPGAIYVVNVQKTRADLIAGAELRALAARFPNVHLLTAVTREPADDAHLSGRLTAERLRDFVPNLKKLPVFLCGSEPMMAATRGLLRSLGVPPERIATEEFTAGPPPQGLGEGETDGPAVVPAAAITFTRAGRSVTAPGETTVLEAAEQVGVPMPYECRSGLCGQCKVRCTEGAVTMESRDALSSKEEKAGYILACQSRATTTALTIDA